MQSVQGYLLIASPFLPDPNFRKSVVLIVQHDDDGAMGVILNRPSDNRVEDFWRDQLQEECQCEDFIGVGGPIGGPMMAVHNLREYGEERIFHGVYFATQRHSILSVVAEQESAFRLFSGYAGWGAGQLEGELETGSWLTEEATYDDVFGDHDDLWKEVTRRIGAEILAESLKLKGAPDDASMN